MNNLNPKTKLYVYKCFMSKSLSPLFIIARTTVYEIRTAICNYNTSVLNEWFKYNLIPFHKLHFKTYHIVYNVN